MFERFTDPPGPGPIWAVGWSAESGPRPRSDSAPT